MNRPAWREYAIRPVNRMPRIRNDYGSDVAHFASRSREETIGDILVIFLSTRHTRVYIYCRWRKKYFTSQNTLGTGQLQAPDSKFCFLLRYAPRISRSTLTPSLQNYKRISAFLGLSATFNPCSNLPQSKFPQNFDVYIGSDIYRTDCSE